MNTEDGLFESVKEIEDSIDCIRSNIDIINSRLQRFEFTNLDSLLRRVEEKEEKLQNVYDKLNAMINEYKGFVSIQRAEFKENCDVIRKFHSGLRAMFSDEK